MYYHIISIARLYKTRTNVYSLIAIVHVVMDRVQPRLIWARISSFWAPFRSTSRGRRIGNHVAVTVASTLESMVETEPMSNFMRESLTKVVLLCGTSWYGREENDAPISVEVLGFRCSIGGVVGVSKSTFRELVLEVDVKGSIISSTEG